MALTSPLIVLLPTRKGTVPGLEENAHIDIIIPIYSIVVRAVQ